MNYLPNVVRYSPAVIVSHHQVHQATTSGRVPAILAAAHPTRASTGRPGVLNGTERQRSMHARPSAPPPPSLPTNTLHPYIFSSFHGERARLLPSFPADR
ncbi:unnamed protein product [Leptidea sinapis]|uniref:Uncharacterized protein n=1 Tax=Leptidea sinapis TaxID=189913 RepID=A0A5E4PY41_9NEOP|nr:unnamed protein product [Leptidea sinapis]